MTAAHVRWETVKAERRANDPDLDDPERLARARAELNAAQIGYDLKQMRKASRMSQAEVAEELQVPVEQISRMEQGDVELTGVADIAAYVAAIGGRLRLVADLWRTTTTLVDYSKRTAEPTQRGVA